MAMIIKSNPNAKINVCAPSNSAVDEILSRIAHKGLIGFTEKQLPNMLLRIGAMTHTPDPALKKFNLDDKLRLKAEGIFVGLIKQAK